MTETVKKKPRRVSRVGRDAEPKPLARELPPRFTIPKDLSDEDRAALEGAKSLLTGVERKMLALVRAAAERWRPGQSLWDTDETSAPVFGDDEYADFVSVVEFMAEAASLKAVGGFMGVPESILDDVVHERLKLHLLPAPPPKANLPFIIRHGRREPTE